MLSAGITVYSCMVYEDAVTVHDLVYSSALEKKSLGALG